MDLFGNCVYSNCKKKMILEYREENFLEHYFEKNQSRKDGFSAAYDISLEHLNDVDLSGLIEWKRLYDIRNIKYPLDCLYKLTYKNEMKNMLP